MPVALTLMKPDAVAGGRWARQKRSERTEIVIQKECLEGAHSVADSAGRGSYRRPDTEDLQKQEWPPTGSLLSWTLGAGGRRWAAVEAKPCFS